MKPELKKKYQEDCNHEFVGYQSCCYCGFKKNYQGEIISPYIAANMRDLSDDFSKWYFEIKEQTGQPPLAMQIFYWFSQRVRPNLFEYEEEIKKLEGIIELKEKERQQWADLCINKQAKIDELTTPLQ